MPNRCTCYTTVKTSVSLESFRPSGKLLVPRLGCTRDSTARERNVIYAMSFSVPQSMLLLEPWSPCAYNEFSGTGLSGIQLVLDGNKSQPRCLSDPCISSNSLFGTPLDPRKQAENFFSKRRPFHIVVHKAPCAITAANRPL